MKPINQRIAIAQAIGAKWRNDYAKSEPDQYAVLSFQDRPQESPNDWRIDDKSRLAWDIPRYEEDLNAMHEAENTVLRRDGEVPLDGAYRDALANICIQQWTEGKHWSPFPDFATAPQRAEAFLRTLNLWTE